jgi:hypothetical protein
MTAWSTAHRQPTATPYTPANECLDGSFALAEVTIPASDRRNVTEGDRPAARARGVSLEQSPDERGLRRVDLDQVAQYRGVSGAVSLDLSPRIVASVRS